MKHIVGLAFAHLNLRRNPFGELNAQERGQLAIVEISDITAFLNQPSTNLAPAVQIVGEKGYGKTTHLLALQNCYPLCTYTWMPEGEHVTVNTNGDPVFVDEAQRLSRKQQVSLWRENKRLVLGTHDDFSDSLRSAGRPVLTIEARRHTSPAQVHAIMNERIRIFRRSLEPVPEFSLSVAEQLCERYGSDVRAMLGCLYEHFQSMKDFEDVRKV